LALLPAFEHINAALSSLNNYYSYNWIIWYTKL